MNVPLSPLALVVSTFRSQIPFIPSIYLYCLLTTFIFNSHVFLYILENEEALSFFTIKIATAWALLVFFLTFFLLSVLSLISLHLCKIVAGLIFALNVVSFYFMKTYQVIIDRTMIGNILNTRYVESSQYVSLVFALIFIFLVILPSIYIFQVKIVNRRRISCAIHLIATTSICVLGIYFLSSTWLWIDKHAKVLGGLTLPWSYIVNSARYYQNYARENELRLPLPDGVFNSDEDRIVVLVIGESARSANFSHYGYERNTNPYTKALNFHTVEAAESCSTYTTASIECILSHSPNTERGNRYETLIDYLQRQGVNVVWRTKNWGESKIQPSKYLKAGDLKPYCTRNCDFDEVLLADLEQDYFNSKSGKTLIVLHQSGSHGPTYYKKYPKEFEKFLPVCMTTEIGKCTRSELVNAYDNTIVYTDYILSRVIASLTEKRDLKATMIYISDHGESLGEQGFYLHGTPYLIAPRFQKEIPFLLWMTDSMNQSYSFATANGVPSSQAQFMVFHTVMTAFGFESPIYNPNFSLLQPKKNRILVDN